MGMHDFNNQNFQQNLKVSRKDPSAFRLVEIKYESLKKIRQKFKKIRNNEKY